MQYTCIYRDSKKMQEQKDELRTACLCPCVDLLQSCHGDERVSEAGVHVAESTSGSRIHRSPACTTKDGQRECRGGVVAVVKNPEI